MNDYPMPCRGARHPDEDAEMVPEITDPNDRAWILSQVDPDWRSKFFDAQIAWEFMYQFNAPEMDTLALEVDRDNRATAALRWDFRDEIVDITWPALARRQAN